MGFKSNEFTIVFQLLVCICGSVIVNIRGWACRYTMSKDNTAQVWNIKPYTNLEFMMFVHGSVIKVSHNREGCRSKLEIGILYLGIVTIP